MKGNSEIIAALNRLLTNELSAMDQYFVHARMYDDWGLNALFERINHESDDERMHASKLIERILFLEGKPDVASRAPYPLAPILRKCYITICSMNIKWLMIYAK